VSQLDYIDREAARATREELRAFDDAAGWVPPADPAPVTLSELQARPPGAYATTTPALTMSKVPPVASPGAKQLFADLVGTGCWDPSVVGALDVIAEHDPRDIMDLRWAWKVKAPLE
jgi:hypothetical protein